MVQQTKDDRFVDRSPTNDPFRGIEIGDTVNDRITGFTGIAMARVEYLTGCHQIFILPRIDNDNELREGHWFDVERVGLVQRGTVKVFNAVKQSTEGADLPKPKGRL